MTQAQHDRDDGFLQWPPAPRRPRPALLALLTIFCCCTATFLVQRAQATHDLGVRGAVAMMRAPDAAEHARAAAAAALRRNAIEAIQALSDAAMGNDACATEAIASLEHIRKALR